MAKANKKQKSENRNSPVISLLVLVVIFLLSLQVSLAQPLQNGAGDSNGIISTLSQLPILAASTADYYYEDGACRESFESVMAQFQGQIEEGTVRETTLSNAKKRVESLVGIAPSLSSLPILVLRSNPSVIIAGERACSSDFLIRSLCRYFPNGSVCPITQISQTTVPFPLQCSSKILALNHAP